MTNFERLPVHDKPKHLYIYHVTGRGPFPFDMLRYDSAWPATSETASDMAVEKGWKCIKLRSYREPTVGRWESFGYRVTKDHISKTIKV